MITRLLKRTFIFLFMVLLAVPVLAQDGAKAYAVIGNKPVNARSCPKVDCPVIQSIQPGETVMVVDTVTGDVALGSDQWHKVELNGKTMYVHSALIQASAAANTGDSSQSTQVDTSVWAKYKGKGYSFLAPKDWVDLYTLFNDKDYVEAYSEMRGIKPEEFRANWEATKANGLVAKLSDGTNLTMELERIAIKDWPNKPTLKALKSIFKVSLTETGAKVISEDMISLPVGDCLHIHSKQIRDNGNFQVGTQIVQYVTLTADYMYVLSFYTTQKAFAKADPILDTIAQSLIFIRGNANA